MAENEMKILTPKDKQLLDQKIRSKKKQFIRFLQSNQNCLPHYCTTIPDEFRKVLETKMKKLIAEHDDDDEEATNPTNRIKHSQKPNRKAIKFSEISFGLNEAFKMIERKQISMIWLEEKSLAMNLKNIIKKLCADNRIMCLIFELKNLKTLFNVSSLAIMAFKQTITVAESRFNEIYSIVRNKIDSPQSSIPLSKPVELAQDEIDDKDKSNNQPANFYLDNSDDRYSEMMKKRIMNNSQMDSSTDNRKFIPNESFIAFTITNDDGQYFLDYKQPKSFEEQIEIIWPDQSHIEQRKQSSKRFAEQLYELDQFSEIPFKAPRQIKGLCDEPIGEKRKQKADKRRKRKELLRNKNKK